MQNGDEASPSIILAGQALIVKMLITLEPHGIFGSNFILLGFTEQNFGRSSPFSENAHYSGPHGIF